MTWLPASTFLGVLVMTLVAFPLAPQRDVTSAPSVAAAAPETKLSTQFTRPPLRFEVNAGQTDPEVHFLARTNDGTLFLTADAAVLRLPKLPDETNSAHPQSHGCPRDQIRRARRGSSAPH